VELSQCQRLSKHKDGGSWRCPGLRGYPVYFAEGDLRHYLAFGPVPEKRRSATQTLGPFNDIFRGSKRPTIEWRIERNAKGQDVPYATIVRYATASDGEKGEFLVITKVDAKDSCLIAIIDARANPDAMVMARTWANTEARKRPCPDRPEQLGQTSNQTGKKPL
ncbi:unnamed protein product, partial [Phaeothamnion confervicola]